MQQIQVGIIGLGGIGRQFLAEMQNHDRFTVTSAWDPSETSNAIATTDWPDLTITENADQILSDPSIDMIYIASPPDSHCDYILAAIDAGKAIYCEKPLGVNLARSRQVAAKVAKSGLPNIVNFNHGRALSSCLVEEKIQDGEVGRISGIDTLIHLSRWPRDFQETATWLARRNQGGFTREMLSHWIYLTYRLFGPGKLIYKNVCYPSDGISAETRLTAELDFSGVPLFIKAACGGAGPVGSEYTIWGDKLSFRLQSGGRLSISDNGKWREETSDHGSEDRERTLDGVAACMAGERIVMPNVADALAVQELIEEMLG
jgi:1,5-anhydro-D-fructose reductase (1,5-anhydro-D-mannitol-forming)